MRLLITGANGFVGEALCREAVARGFRVRAATRRASALGEGIENCVIGELDANHDWSAALEGVEVVIHLAARVHVMQDRARDPLAEFRKVNVAASEHLAQQAARAGVRRLVYVSSIKVNGEATSGAQRYTENDAPQPQDPYGQSKWEAEQALLRVAQATGLEIVIVRPPLVYGPGVKGNFLHLLRLVARGIPLPLAKVHNRRDLLYLGNLVDALLLCATHPAAAGHTYLVCDGAPLSSAELVRRLAVALQRPARLLPVPERLLRCTAALFGKSAQIERLLGSLQVDDARIRRELGWQPPYTLTQGLQATADWYRLHD